MSPGPGNRPLLLLVEDEAALAASMAANLEPDYEVDVAANADEARLLLASRRYAAILSDHMMPGREQGLDFLVQALQQQPAAKRILITGYLNPELLARSVSLAQLSACLIKPVESERLKREIEQALAT